MKGSEARQTKSLFEVFRRAKKRDKNRISVAHKWYYTQCLFWPSTHNFGDTELKFCILLSTSKSLKMETLV